MQFQRIVQQLIKIALENKLAAEPSALGQFFRDYGYYFKKNLGLAPKPRPQDPLVAQIQASQAQLRTKMQEAWRLVNRIENQLNRLRSNTPANSTPPPEDRPITQTGY